MKTLHSVRLSISLFLVLGQSSIASPETQACNVNCEPNGSCQDGECVCDPGFAGADCSFPFQTCPDGILTCFDGAECTRTSLTVEDGSRSNYECDCSTMSDASPFQIKECEAPESEACVEGQLSSDYAFCTNGGRCINKIQYGEPHAGCKCPNDFEGRHCQYRKGTAPEAELKISFATQEHHVEGFVIAIILLVVAFVVGGWAFIVRHKHEERKRAMEKDIEEITNDIALEENDAVDTNKEGEMA